MYTKLWTVIIGYTWVFIVDVESYIFSRTKKSAVTPYSITQKGVNNSHIAGRMRKNGRIKTFLFPFNYHRGHVRKCYYWPSLMKGCVIFSASLQSCLNLATFHETGTVITFSNMKRSSRMGCLQKIWSLIQMVIFTYLATQGEWSCGQGFWCTLGRRGIDQNHFKIMNQFPMKLIYIILSCS